MRRSSCHLSAFPHRSVACAHFRPHIRNIDACLPSISLDSLQRIDKVLLNVIVQSLQRRYVKNIYGVSEFLLATHPEKLVYTPQKSGESFPRAGW